MYSILEGKMESGVAIGISLAALFVSVVSPIFEYVWNKKINEQNLSSEYFREIFGDIIYIDLPKAIEYIHFDGQEVSGTEELENVLRELRHRMIYFKKNRPDFYKKLINEIQELENYVVTQSGKKDSSSFAAFYNGVDTYIERIYSYINDGYLGKKIKRNKKK